MDPVLAALKARGDAEDAQLRARRSMCGTDQGGDDEDEEAESDEEGDEDDVDTPSVQDARRGLCEAIDGVHGTGSFAAFGIIQYLPDPYLTIETGEPAFPIMLPLAAHDAQKIIAAAHQAPFGKGSETIIDQSVRNTWELDHTQFTVRNPAFPVAQTFRQACEGLGLSEQGVEAQAYKLLLYEPGAMFKPHTDTEKTPGMFGTMIISLPSYHAGGTLQLSHSGLEMRFDTCTQSASWAAWYSDVRHEVKPVTDGYRLVLTYDLVQKASSGQIYGLDFGLRFPALQEAVAMWSRAADDDGDESPAVYALEHQYTDASISLQALKGDDLAKAQALQHFATDHDVVLFLASCEKEISGGAEESYHYGSKRRRHGRGDDDGDSSDGYHEITEEFESSLKLTRVVDVHGMKLATGINITEEDFLQEEPYDGRDPTANHYTGHTGNAGASATHWYRDTVIVMIPKQHVIKPFLGAYSSSHVSQDITPLLNYVVRNAELYPLDKGASADVRTVCRHVFEVNQRRKLYSLNQYKQATVEHAFQVLVRFCTSTDRSSFDDLAVATKSSGSGDRLSVDSLTALGRLCKSMNFMGLEPRAIRLTGGAPRGAASHLRAGLERAQEGRRQDFVTSSIQQLITNLSTTTVSGQDGGALADILLIDSTSGWFRDELSRLVLQCVREHATDTYFAISFLAAWGSRSETTFSKNLIASVYGDVAQAMLPKFQVTIKERTAPQPQAYSRYAMPMAQLKQNSQEKAQQRRKFGHDLHAVWQRTTASPGPLHSAALLRAIISDVKSRRHGLVFDTHLAFLQFLLPDAVGQLDGLMYPLLRDTFSTILEEYVYMYVGPQPGSGGGTLSRSTYACRCKDCWPVNLFLASSTQYVGRFQMGKTRRQHVHNMLDARRFDGTHTTKRTSREPQTLVVTKRNREAQVSDAWLRRCRIAHEEIRNLHAVSLRRIIPLTYDRIVAMDMVIASPGRRPSFLPATVLPRHTPAPPNQGRSVPGTEVIDLCGDSD
ncbi:hypothetical protein LTR53_009592 [Teratosphaeriaceae sp. CCFEE 6253]|nr:hypothetical protein LTR53_009592 [Teratosphaeriaceae sp. CCFEE 6253]